MTDPIADGLAHGWQDADCPAWCSGEHLVSSTRAGLSFHTESTWDEVLLTLHGPLKPTADAEACSPDVIGIRALATVGTDESWAQFRIASYGTIGVLSGNQVHEIVVQGTRLIAEVQPGNWPGDEKERPYWQHSQCPVWCLVDHNDCDALEARVHAGDGPYTEADEPAGPARDLGLPSEQWASIHPQQHVENAAPRLELSFSGEGPPVHLTLAEAEQFLRTIAGHAHPTEPPDEDDCSRAWP